MMQSPMLAARAEAFVRLTETHLDRSYRLARAIVLDPDDAEDATHDAIVQAWRRWASLRDHARFEPWFQRILINTCRDRLRRRSKHQTRDLSSALALVSHDDGLLPVDERSDMGQALAHLSAEHRVVVALRYYLDLPVQEIAIRLGVPVGTVNSRLHHALKRIRAALDSAGPGDSLR